LFGKFKSSKSRGLLIGVLIIAAALRLWVSWQPVETLVTKNLPDDAFYYFVLSHNSVSTGSVSTDGINPTNGFHPLWLITIMPIFGWASLGEDLPIHLTLTLASFIDLASIWLIARLAAGLTQRWEAGLLAAWLYAINPVVILQATNGLETALGIFTLLLFLVVYKKWLTSKSPLVYSALVGILAGSMILARSDSFFVLGISFVAVLWSQRNALWLKKTFVAGLGALGAVTPWLIWSGLTVGGLIQESGLAVPYVLHERVPGMDWQFFMRESWYQLSNAQVWQLGTFTGMPLIIGAALWALVFIALVRVWSKLKNRDLKLIIVTLLGSALAQILFHAVVRWYPRPWYFVTSALAFALCFAIVAQKYFDRPRVIVFVTTLISVYFVSSGLTSWRLGFYPLQKEMLAASNWLASNVPPDSTVGSFNAGIYSYYSGLRVVNLDGVVNHRAYEALQDRQLFPYMESERVDYLVDFDFYVQDLYAPFMGSDFSSSFQEMATLSDLGHEGFLRVYRLKP
jgi:hypothetical protein